MDILGSKHLLREDTKAFARMLYAQGYDLDIEQTLRQIDALPDGYDAIIEYAMTLLSLPVRADFKYCEPNDLAAIRAQRPSDRIDIITPTQKELIPRPVILKDKVYGGVYGRIAGCILGKPFEMGWNAENIRNYLEPVHAYPLQDYAPMYSPYSNLGFDTEVSRKEYLSYAQADDDTSYFTLALQTLEKHGRGFTSQQAALEWVNNLPHMVTFGPSHSTYRKLVNATVWHEAPLPTGSEWERFLRFNNHGEEQIDAMIRADSYGLVCPLRPEEAAGLAYKDALLTNRHTGLYASMWVAGCIAGAYYFRDPVQVIQCGLGQIPENSRYAEAIRQALDICASTDTWEQAYPEINCRWGHLGHAGTINETAGIINALVHSKDYRGCVDYEKAICTTVMHGWDTDCAAATCGCIAGVMAGFAEIPDKWIRPLNDTYYTFAALENDHRISAFADRVLHMIDR